MPQHKHNSNNEIIKTNLEIFKTKENKLKTLNKELRKGEQSGFVKNFNKTAFLKSLNK